MYYRVIPIQNSTHLMGYIYSCMYLESVRILLLHEMGINVPEDSKMRVKMSVFILYSSPFQRKKMNRQY